MRLGARALVSGGLLLAVLGPLGAGSVAASAGGKPTLIIPAYVYPDGAVDGSWQLTGEWATLATTPPPSGGGYVVADVCDDAWAPSSAPCGSGDVANTDYVGAIKAVQHEGWTVLGYIDTAYGGETCYGTSPSSPANACQEDSLSYLESQVAAWRTFYGVTGYYFDDVCTASATSSEDGWGTANGCSGVNPSGGSEGPAAFFKQLVGAIDPSALVVLNPGTRPEASTFLSSSGWTSGGRPVALAVNVFEGCYSGAGSAGCPSGDAWNPGTDPSSFASASVGISMQVYGTPTKAAMRSVDTAAQAEGASLLYVTDETNAAGNPYSQLPSYLAAEESVTG